MIRTFFHSIRPFIALAISLLAPAVALAKYIGCDPSAPEISIWTADRMQVSFNVAPSSGSNQFHGC